jgi:hypothetical protein
MASSRLVAAIEFFEVPPGEDDAFVAAWRAEHGAAPLFRAIRADAESRFVGIAPEGPYTLVHEEGVVDEPDGVLLIDSSALAPAPGRRGYLGLRRYAADGLPDVSIARWSSPLMVQRARPAVSGHAALYQRVTR